MTEEEYKKLLRNVLNKTVGNTEFLVKYLNEEVIPLLPKKMSLDKEGALILNYNRIYLFANTLRFLNDEFHYQTAASAARSVFELYLDLNDLVTSNDNFSKFYDWPILELYRCAKKTLEFNKKYPDEKIQPEKDYEKIVADNEKMISELINSNWNGNEKIKHWLGKSIEQRASSQGVETEKMYVQLYKILSWQVHAGNATASSTKDGLQIEMSFLSQQHVQMILIASTITINGFLNLEKTKPDLLKDLDKISKMAEEVDNEFIKIKRI
jgi:hypothetical protein